MEGFLPWAAVLVVAAGALMFLGGFIGFCYNGFRGRANHLIVSVFAIIGGGLMGWIGGVLIYFMPLVMGGAMLAIGTISLMISALLCAIAESKAASRVWGGVLIVSLIVTAIGAVSVARVAT